MASTTTLNSIYLLAYTLRQLVCNVTQFSFASFKELKFMANEKKPPKKPTLKKILIFFPKHPTLNKFLILCSKSFLYSMSQPRVDIIKNVLYSDTFILCILERSFLHLSSRRSQPY